MKINLDTHDMKITISAHDEKGVWAAEIWSKVSRQFRVGGQLPTSAHLQTLQVVALWNGLRGLTKSQTRKLWELHGSKKPRVVVLTSDESFAAALTAVIDNDTEQMAVHPIRCGGNFRALLPHKLRGFEATVLTPEANDHECDVLRRWAVTNLVDKSLHIPRALAPQVIGTLTWSPTFVSDVGHGADASA